MWLLLNSAPLSPGHSSGCGRDGCPTLEFSGNWAAVVGVLICFALLFAWYWVKIHEIPEDEDVQDQ